MNESEFNDMYESTIESIQEAVDNSDADIDCDEVGGVLTIDFENGSKLIFSKQTPVKQLWLAAKSGGFHFDYSESGQNWICDSGDKETLQAMLSRLATEQAGEAVRLL